MNMPAAVVILIGLAAVLLAIWWRRRRKPKRRLSYQKTNADRLQEWQFKDGPQRRARELKQGKTGGPAPDHHNKKLQGKKNRGRAANL